MKIFGLEIGAVKKKGMLPNDIAVGVGEAIAEAFSDDSISTNEADKGFTHISVAKIAEVASSVQWGAYRMRKDGKVEPVEGHIVNDFLAKPSPAFTFRKFVYKAVGQREFTGFVPVRVKTVGSDLRVYSMDASRVQPKFDEDGVSIVKFTVANNIGGTTDVTTKEMVAWIVPDFFDSKRNVGTVEKIRDWLVLDRSLNKLQRELAKNRSYVGGVVETGVTKDDLLKKWTRKWRSRVREKGEDIILPKGAKYTRFAYNAKEMEMTEQDSAHTAKILKAFSMPKEMLGEVDASGRANVDGAYYGFVKFKVVPILEDLRDFLNEDVLPLITDDETVFLDFDNPVPKDVVAELEERKASLGGKGWKTQNEVRAEDGLEPIDGGDELNNAPTFALGMNALARATSRVPAKVKNAHAKVVKADVAFKETAERVASDIGVKADKIGDAIREALHKDFTGRVTEKQKSLLAVFLEHTKELEKSVLENHFKDEKAVKAQKVDYFDVAGETDALFISSENILKALIETEGDNAFRLIENPAGNFDPKDKKLVKAIKQAFVLRGSSFNTTTLKLLNDTVQEGIAKGESLAGLRKRVSAVFENIPKYRAKNIAQDIAFTTANKVTRSAYEQSKVVTKIMWHTAEDEKVCPWCGGMNGKTVGIKEQFFDKGDTFEVAGQKLDLDFEAINHPPIHAACRCFILPEQIVV